MKRKFKTKRQNWFEQVLTVTFDQFIAFCWVQYNKSSLFCTQTIIRTEFLKMPVRKGKPSLLSRDTRLGLHWSWNSPLLRGSLYQAQGGKKAVAFYWLNCTECLSADIQSLMTGKGDQKNWMKKDKTDQISNSRHSLKRHKAVFSFGIIG